MSAAEGEGRQTARWWYALALVSLFLLGLSPFFQLFPLLHDIVGSDPTLAPAGLWLAMAVAGGAWGGIGGSRRRRRLYRAAWTILATSCLSALASRRLVYASPLPHGLAALLRLDGEGAQDASFYEVWLLLWFACLPVVRLTRFALAWVSLGYRGADGQRPTGARCRSRRSLAQPGEISRHAQSGEEVVRAVQLQDRR